MTVPVGAFANAAGIIFGSLIGVLVRKSLSDRIKTIIFQGIGLVTLVMGVSMGLAVEDFLTLIFAMILGGMLGEWLRLDQRLDGFGLWLKAKLKTKDAGFTDGFISTTLLFCIGSMTIMSALNEGLTGDRSLIYTKAMLDFFSSIVFASIYGIGVIFSAIPLFLIQAGIIILAAQSQGFFTAVLINQLAAVGGVLILGIGLNLLEIKKINTMNLMPALLVIAVLTVIFL